MIKIKATYKGTSAAFIRSLNTDPKVYLRPVAIEMIPIIANRIHVEGHDANGNQIGTYTPGYVKVRQRKYKRSADTKVIASLTRQIENDYAVIGTENGWAIGFNNTVNRDKANWVEQTYGKKIWKFTPEETKIVMNKINDEINKGIDGNYP